MRKIEKTYDYMKQIRNVWVINPRTRIQENKKKNIKKRRQEENKLMKDGLEQ